MHPKDLNCRILIVDNDVEQAKNIAFELEQIRPDLLGNQSLIIEISNSAYFVAKHLENSINGGKPPWDIILSDVYMPIPSTPLHNDVAIEEAVSNEVKYKDKKWRFWEYQYTWNSHQEGTPEHGGLHIVRKIVDLKKANADTDNLKVILISDKLFDQSAKNFINDLLASEKTWFNFYSKASWDESTEGQTTHLYKPDIFRWAIIHAINEKKSEYWGDFLSSSKGTYIAFSKALKETVTNCKILAKNITVDSVLITGEPGTGKSMIAAKLHEIRQNQLKVKGPFVTVECTSISDELFQSGLFGHIKGAFTGADNNKNGFIEAAKNGTLFLDEIGDLSETNQGKILRLLQDRKFVKVGHNKDEVLEANLLVFATNKNLERMKETNLFRKDLFSRIDKFKIQIPPLRERPDEIVPLAEHFLKISADNLTLSEEAKEFLMVQNWEGNVRQLKNIISSAATYCTSNDIKVSDLKDLFSNTGQSVNGTNQCSTNAQHECTPENILNGEIKWHLINKESFNIKCAVMIIVKSMWQKKQNQLAGLLDVKANTLERFFSDLRKKIKNNEIDIENLKPLVSSNYHPLLETYFQSIRYD